MARRVGLAALVVAGVIIATFVIARVVPGDPAATWAGPHASAAQVAAARGSSAWTARPWCSCSPTSAAS